jgi:NAD-dependent dihydropyrimidine dehydrogenase PreA subunit
MTTHRYLKNVTTLSLNQEACTGCGMCTQVCPHAVFRMESGKAAVSRRDACMECGACALNCPAGALSVNPGVGCAAAIIAGFLTGTEPNCGGDQNEGGCC